MGKISNKYETTNLANLNDLKEVVRSEQAIAFIGAGCSVPLGYPSWSSLVKNLLDECEKNNPSLKNYIKDLRKETDLLFVAGLCKNYLGPKYNPYIKQIFGPKLKKCTDEHKIIMRLPFGRFITSNYDPSLDFAFQKVRDDLSEYFTHSNTSALSDFSIVTGTLKKTIFYMHGRYDNPEEIILTETDYQQHYDFNQSYKETLKNIFSVYPVVFVGSSLTDVDFLAILRYIGALFKHYPRGHFAILPYPKKLAEIEANKLKTKYNITPVFYKVKSMHD
ncbi:MAG: SIR2 family protein, partial [Candidatus Subteraquimicrobiales bacterium]|nr:SIR2 family protein [Candidatus Subteraquimicrobiales bacterium]